jgi:hypothetical protein
LMMVYKTNPSSKFAHSMTWLIFAERSLGGFIPDAG